MKEKNLRPVSFADTISIGGLQEKPNGKRSSPPASPGPPGRAGSCPRRLRSAKILLIICRSDIGSRVMTDPYAAQGSGLHPCTRMEIRAFRVCSKRSADNVSVVGAPFALSADAVSTQFPGDQSSSRPYSSMPVARSRTSSPSMAIARETLVLTSSRRLTTQTASCCPPSRRSER